jgi:hypothetical protein
MPEIHHAIKDEKKGNGFKNHSKFSDNSKKRRRNKRKGKKNTKAPRKDTTTSKDEKCKKCGCYNHPTNKCRTPRHLVALYQQALKGKAAEGQEYEAHFATPSNLKADIGSPSMSQKEPCTSNLPLLTYTEPMDIDNVIVDYSLDDVFGDLN